MVDSNRWLIVGFSILVLTLVPLLFIFLGVGRAWRGMAAVPRRLAVSLLVPITP